MTQSYQIDKVAQSKQNKNKTNQKAGQPLVLFSRPMVTYQTSRLVGNASIMIRQGGYCL